MGHDYGITPKFISLTPTRDNEAAPGNRLSDKHSKLFHGKTLDEWLMIQLWSSKYLGKGVFICETTNHYEKLSPMADKYGIELCVRPEQMLTPICDSGAIPIDWASRKFLTNDYWSLIMTPLVVSPCRPPGLFDFMVEEYQRIFSVAPDNERSEMWIVGASDVDGTNFEVDDDATGHQVGTDYINKLSAARFSTTQHWIGATHWWRAYCTIRDARHDIKFTPKVFDIEPWIDIHIDTQDQWDQAEYWFGKKILSQGEDCYERYRETWSKNT
jgi:hypothetical protein